MGSRLIQRCERKQMPDTHSLNFWRREDGEPGRSGYGFDCDAKGRILHAQMGEVALQSLGHCLDNPGLFYPAEVTTYVGNRYWEPAIVQCDCGEKVYVHPIDGYSYEQCECGRTYNLSGQLLTDPRTWMPDDCEGDPERPDTD